MTCGMALAMSPMTAAIMSAVPSRRAGAGSAMNDATRELGAALGIAVMGSIAASQYGSAVAELVVGLPDELATKAESSISGALQVASSLPGAAGDALRVGAESAFMDGMHFAVIAGTVIALFASVVVYRFMPRERRPRGRDARWPRVDGGRRRARPRRHPAGVRRRGVRRPTRPAGRPTTDAAGVTARPADPAH